VFGGREVCSHQWEMKVLENCRNSRAMELEPKTGGTDLCVYQWEIEVLKN
jgi:hypothetical protein